jgi:serine/threonine-protein kinase RsbW
MLWQQDASPRSKADVIDAQGDGWQHLVCHSPAEATRAIKRVIDDVAAEGYSDTDVFAVELGLQEAVSNALAHGNQGNPNKRAWVSYCVKQDSVFVQIEDEGLGFDPRSVPDPTAAENVPKENGRGLLLMRTFMTWVRFNEMGNCVTMCRRRSAR